jgi:hypothetical protein
VTLTWHYGHQNIEGSYYKILNCFLQRFRDNFSEFDYIWRLEFQKRGAPHYHIIFFARHKLSKRQFSIFKKSISKYWHEIADPNSYRHEEFGCLVALAGNYKQAFFYLTKYCCKESLSSEENYSGRRWGRSSGLDTSYVYQIDVPIAVYRFFRECAHKVLNETRHVSPEFLDFVKSDESCFLYLDCNFVKDVIEKLIIKTLRSTDADFVKTTVTWLNSISNFDLF